MKLGGLQKQTLIDYPSKVACTVFTARCNFRCPFCYNASLITSSPSARSLLATSTKTRRQALANSETLASERSESDQLSQKTPSEPSEKQFLNFLKERKEFLDGVVICGGEPTLHEDLPDFIRKIKNMGFAVKLDTNGSNPEMLRQLVENELVDYVALDVKAPPEKYSKVAGTDVDVEKIRRSISILKDSDITYELRTTVVPTLLDKEDIVEIADWLAPAKKYYIQQFQTGKDTVDPKFKTVKPYSKKYLEEIRAEIKSKFDVCEVRA